MFSKAKIVAKGGFQALVALKDLKKMIHSSLEIEEITSIMQERYSKKAVFAAFYYL